jgi:pimeloyl-ACP methyl ester carboxylesterase
MCKTRSVTAALFRILLLWGLITVSGCAWLDNHQRQIIYRPTPTAAGNVPELRPGDERFFLSVPEPGAPQRITLWWLPHAKPHAPTLLYLHGTFRNLQENLHKIDALRAAGFAILAVDYRGWGESTAIIPSEQSILQDAQLAWAELVRREPCPTQRVIYGHSMGSGVAVDLASHLQSPTDYGGVILESAFTSFTDVAHEAGRLASLLNLFTHERFASIDKIAHVQAPLLMIHGTQDSTIPIKLGRRLYEAASPPKQWLSIEGGQHSDLDLKGQPAYQDALVAFRTRYLAPQPEYSVCSPRSEARDAYPVNGQSQGVAPVQPIPMPIAAAIQSEYLASPACAPCPHSSSDRQ